MKKFIASIPFVLFSFACAAEVAPTPEPSPEPTAEKTGQTEEAITCVAKGGNCSAGYRTPCCAGLICSPTSGWSELHCH